MSDPDYTGFGTRFLLVYLAPGDITLPTDALAAATPAFVPLPIPPAAPTGFTVTPGYEKNTLTWDMVNGMTYSVFWGINPYDMTEIAGISSGFIHTGLADNTNYHYQLMVTDAYGNSAVSAELYGLTLPAAPTGLTATGGLEQALLTWTVLAGLGYNLYYSTSPGVTPITGTKVPGPVEPYMLTGLTDSTEYYFVATATNATGEGPACAVVSATTNAPTYAAWTGTFDSLSTSSHITLSGANLIATQNGVAYFVNSGGTVLHTGAAGWKCRITIGAIGAGVTVGVSAIALPLDGAQVGDNTQGWGYASSGDKRHNAGSGNPGVAYGAAYTTGDYVDIDLDLVAQTLKFAKNGVDQGIAFISTDGILSGATFFPVVSLNNAAAVSGNFAGPFP